MKHYMERLAEAAAALGVAFAEFEIATGKDFGYVTDGITRVRPKWPRTAAPPRLRRRPRRAAGRPLSPRRNRARSEPGGKTAARRAA